MRSRSSRREAKVMARRCNSGGRGSVSGLAPVIFPLNETTRPTRSCGTYDHRYPEAIHDFASLTHQERQGPLLSDSERAVLVGVGRSLVPTSAIWSHRSRVEPTYLRVRRLPRRYCPCP